MSERRIASFDFGPVNTSMCLATVVDGASSLEIEDWIHFQWRDIMLSAGAPSSTSSDGLSMPPPPPPLSLDKPLTKLKKDEVIAELNYWQAPPTAETREHLVKQLRAIRQKERPNIRKTFYSSYDKYIAMVAENLNWTRPVDVVLLEHQAANFRYENIVLESIVAQHLYTLHSVKGWPVPKFHFLPGAFKFKPFLGSAPKPVVGGRRKKSKKQKVEQHAMNKAYAVQRVLELLEERGLGEWKRRFEEKTFEGDKCDDLADAYLQLEAFLRSGGGADQKKKKKMTKPATAAAPKKKKNQKPKAVKATRSKKKVSLSLS